MGFTRSTTDISVHQKLGDYPNQDNGLSTEELKKTFDKPAETLQNDLNKLEEELENKNSASNLGANPIYGDDNSAPNVQAKLIRIYEQIQNIILNQIPDSTVTTEKIANEAIINEKIKDNTITENKIATGFGFVPKGVICMWSGSTVPAGWYLCNGENGTPDLRDKFVMSSGEKYPLGSNGGEVPYVHTDSKDTSGSGFAYWLRVSSKESSPLPPYYTLAFIMKA